MRLTGCCNQRRWWPSQQGPASKVPLNTPHSPAQNQPAFRILPPRVTFSIRKCRVPRFHEGLSTHPIHLLPKPSWKKIYTEPAFVYPYIKRLQDFKQKCIYSEPSPELFRQKIKAALTGPTQEVLGSLGKPAHADIPTHATGHHSPGLPFSTPY